jgi:hypothetical protein
MSDSNQKPLKQKKVIPNSLRLKSSNKNTFNGSVNQKNMATILNRLPFLHQLKEAQNSLLKLSPVWQRWCAEQAGTSTLNSYQKPQFENESKANNNSSLIKQAKLNSLNNSELSIVCTTPIIASLIKHRQSSLLTTLHEAGFDHIVRIKIQVSLHQTENNSDFQKHQQNDANSLKSDTSSQKNTRTKPDSSALKSIEATQSLINNEQLAASLQRLAETLKKSS